MRIPARLAASCQEYPSCISTIICFFATWHCSRSMLLFWLTPCPGFSPLYPSRARCLSLACPSRLRRDSLLQRCLADVSHHPAEMVERDKASIFHYTK